MGTLETENLREVAVQVPPLLLRLIFPRGRRSMRGMILKSAHCRAAFANFAFILGNFCRYGQTQAQHTFIIQCSVMTFMRVCSNLCQSIEGVCTQCRSHD